MSKMTYRFFPYLLPRQKNSRTPFLGIIYPILRPFFTDKKYRNRSATRMATDSRADIVNLAFSFQFREGLFQLADNVIRVVYAVGIAKITSAVVIFAV